MLLKTQELQNELYFMKQHEEKIAFLKNQYAGRSCFILAPGPSVRDPILQELKEDLHNNLVFCIKGTYVDHASVCDFHFLNDCNLPYKNGLAGYQYSVQSNPIVVASSGFVEERMRSRVGDHQRWDIFCRVLDPNVYPHHNMGYVLENLNFEAGTFDNTYLRPCGPSLTIETVLYMAVHLGVKNIFALGLDGGTKFTHVFADGPKNVHLDGRPRTQAELEFKNWEIDITTSGTGPLQKWLQTKGINLFMISAISTWHHNIPRLSLKEVKKILHNTK